MVQQFFPIFPVGNTARKFGIERRRVVWLEEMRKLMANDVFRAFGRNGDKLQIQSDGVVFGGTASPAGRHFFEVKLWEGEGSAKEGICVQAMHGELPAGNAAKRFFRRRTGFFGILRKRVSKPENSVFQSKGRSFGKKRAYFKGISVVEKLFAGYQWEGEIFERAEDEIRFLNYAPLGKRERESSGVRHGDAAVRSYADVDVFDAFLREFAEDRARTEVKSVKCFCGRHDFFGLRDAAFSERTAPARGGVKLFGGGKANRVGEALSGVYAGDLGNSSLPVKFRDFCEGAVVFLAFAYEKM